MPDFESLYTAEEMRAAEAGHDTDELMERAGALAAEAALQEMHGATEWTVVCGGGANGGDGRIMARHLEAKGKQVRVVDAASRSAELGEPDVIVDAIFGTGFHGTPRTDAAGLIERINAHRARVFSIDVPSGVDASTGEVPGAAVEADATVSFHGRKVGVVVAPGRFHAGRVRVADIGLGPAGTEHRLVLPEILHSIPRRGARDNKYTAGHVLVVGGSPGLTGAPSLTAAAAFRADAGYVTVAARESALPVLEQRLLEAVKRPLPEALGDEAADAVLELAKKASAVALGPGLGRDDGARTLVRRLLAEVELPMVVDADALYELEAMAWGGPRVLTPHEGELKGLLGHDVKERRLAAVREAAERFDCVVVLKGADTLVAAPGREIMVAACGLPSLATAGTGDVLTGIAGAFLAKGVEPQRAAAAAAVAQQRASVEATQRAGLVASDLIDALPRALS
jgi:ADP-dependent NAD(P)H-hydrate dehydratase / NAD(P)H-hydrate epimerase